MQTAINCASHMQPLLPGPISLKTSPFPIHNKRPYFRFQIRANEKYGQTIASYALKTSPALFGIFRHFVEGIGEV
jgi:hypothetical protein